jgi:hypothetical protein
MLLESAAESMICARCDGPMTITHDALRRPRKRCERCDGVAAPRPPHPDEVLRPVTLASLTAAALPPVEPGQLRCQRCAKGVVGDVRFHPECLRARAREKRQRRCSCGAPFVRRHGSSSDACPACVAQRKAKRPRLCTGMQPARREGARPAHREQLQRVPPRRAATEAASAATTSRATRWRPDVSPEAVRVPGRLLDDLPADGPAVALLRGAPVTAEKLSRSQIESLIVARAVVFGDPQLADVAPKVFRLTDIGNAERLIDQFGHGAPLRHAVEDLARLGRPALGVRRDEAGRALREGDRALDAGRSPEPALPGGAEGALRAHAYKSESNKAIGAMLARATAEAGVAISHTELDRDPWTLTVANGELDLKTASSRRTGASRWRRSDADRLGSGGAVRSLGGVPARVLGGSQPLISFVQRAVGYSLTGSTVASASSSCTARGRTGRRPSSRSCAPSPASTPRRRTSRRSSRAAAIRARATTSRGSSARASSRAPRSARTSG